MAVLVKGDGASKVIVTLTNGEPDESIDLSGKTVTLAFTIAGGVLIKRSMTVLPQATNRGEAEYTFTVSDLSVDGELEAEVIVNDGLADQLTSEKFRIKVRPRKG